MPKKNAAAVSKSSVCKKPTPLFLKDPTEILDEIDASLLNLGEAVPSAAPKSEESDDDQEKTVLFRTCVLTEQAEPISPKESSAEPFFASAAKPSESVGKKKNRRRRQIDPTTCERDYTNDEIEFMNALNEYKRSSGRMFPTCSEILEVIRSLGYVRQPMDESDEGEPPMAATPLQSGTPALAGGGDGADGDHQEIVTIFWSGESARIEETAAPEVAADDFEYREPLLIF